MFMIAWDIVIFMDNIKKQIIFWLSDNFSEEEILLADGFESAFVGVGQQAYKLFAIYDQDKCIEELINQGMSVTEACEYFTFNVEGSYVGENTPVFLTNFKK